MVSLNIALRKINLNVKEKMFVWLDRKTLWRLYLTTKEKEWQMMEKIKTDCI